MAGDPDLDIGEVAFNQAVPRRHAAPLVLLSFVEPGSEPPPQVFVPPRRRRWIGQAGDLVDKPVFGGRLVRPHDTDFRDLGNRVLALYRLVRGRDSGVAIDQQGGTVYELRGGKIVHGRSYLSHGEALEAAGLEG